MISILVMFLLFLLFVSSLIFIGIYLYNIYLTRKFYRYDEALKLIRDIIVEMKGDRNE